MLHILVFIHCNRFFGRIRELKEQVCKEYDCDGRKALIRRLLDDNLDPSTDTLNLANFILANYNDYLNEELENNTFRAFLIRNIKLGFIGNCQYKYVKYWYIINLMAIHNVPEHIKHDFSSHCYWKMLFMSLDNFLSLGTHFDNFIEDVKNNIRSELKTKIKISDCLKLKVQESIENFLTRLMFKSKPIDMFNIKYRSTGANSDESNTIFKNYIQNILENKVLHIITREQTRNFNVQQNEIFNAIVHDFFKLCKNFEFSFMHLEFIVSSVSLFQRFFILFTGTIKEPNTLPLQACVYINILDRFLTIITRLLGPYGKIHFQKFLIKFVDEDFTQIKELLERFKSSIHRDDVKAVLKLYAESVICHCIESEEHLRQFNALYKK